MKKVLASLLALICLLGVLSGCGSKQKPSDDFVVGVVPSDAPQQSNSAPSRSEQHVEKEPESESYDRVHAERPVSMGESDRNDLPAEGQAEEPADGFGAELVEEPVKEPTIKRNPISEFTYHTFGDRVMLMSYQGESKQLIILPTYEVDGKEYITDLSELTSIGSSVRSVIFPEGTTEIKKDTLLDNCYSVYFPSSMKVVEDETIGRMNAPSSGKKMVFYAGTESEWNKIFKVVDVGSVGDNKLEEDIGYAIGEWVGGIFHLPDNVGGSIFVDSMYSKSYDSADFAYYFEAYPSDVYVAD